ASISRRNLTKRRTAVAAVLCCHFMGMRTSAQQQPQAWRRIALWPSMTINGVTARAATGSAHGTCQMALTPIPTKAITEKYAHNAASAASALRDALPVTADSLRFSQANQGMIAAAAIRTAIPKLLGRGSLYPRKV